jgi:hypothetical protein
MEEERPSQDTPSESEAQTSRPSGMLIAGIVVVVLLIIAGLFLPPISLGQRLAGGGEATSPANTPTASPTETETAVASNPSIPGEVDVIVSDSSAVVNVSSLSADEAATSIGPFPANASVRGNVFKVEHDAPALQGKIAINVPAGTAVEMTDLYGWNGTLWRFIPSQIDVETRQIVSPEHNLYQAFALVESGTAETVAVAAELLPQETLPEPSLPSLTELSAGTLLLTSTGDLQGEVAELPTGDFISMVRVTNAGGIVDQAALAALLGDSTAQTNQINALVNTAVSGQFSGIHLDYQGVAEAQTEAFTTFVTSLADALHAQNLTLAITLGTPQETNGRWDSAGQDWAALGQAADIVYVQMPLDPTAYSDNGAVMQLLNWATRLLDRTQLTMLVNAGAVDQVGDTFLELSNEEALANFGQLEFVSGGEEVEPGTAIELALSGDATPLEWDGSSLTYRYSYEMNDQTHSVWLGNPAAFSNRLALVERYRLRGAAVRGLGAVTDGEGYATALAAFTGLSAPPETSGAAIVWTVLDSTGSVLASESGSDLTFAWAGEEAAGSYTINAEFALGNAVATLDSVTVVVAEAVVEEVEAETAVVNPGTTAPVAVGNADAVVNANANVRTGPGLSYGLIAGGLSQGTQVQVIGRNTDASWFQIIMPTGGQEGWIFGSLLTLNAGLNVNGLEVVEVAPPTVGEGGGSTTPAAPPPPPVSNAGFILGGQSAGLPIGPMQAAGMTWIKRQHKWSPGNSPTDVQGLISEGHNAGFKVLLSIPGQLNPTSIDFNSYVEFLRGVAALPDPPDAIEVWNEMNITVEWPNGEINPASYVNNMLRPAYNAIKGANPNIMVISGAPAPTGFFGGGCGGGGCDDAPYIAGMMAAGAGSVSDCIGVHYNEGIMPPAATSGDPRGNGGHYTRYFQGMINAYVAAGAGQLCFTELGYLSGEEWGFIPSGFLWKAPYNLTVAEHAQYLAEAVSLGANSGRVRMIIVFNVDFTTWGADPQAGYAMVRPNGSCPACDTIGAVMRGR